MMTQLHQWKWASAGLVTVVSTLALHASVASADSVAIVTHGNDDGPGSLRAALSSGASVITVKDSVSTIQIDSTLVYAGTAPLQVQGSGQDVVANGDYTLFEVSQGADLSVANLNFVGVGGFSAASQGTGKGIFVDVPGDRTGTVTLELNNVGVYNVANHGVHVSDCSLEDDCGSGSGGGGDGSPASIRARLNGVVVDGVGYGKFDADGVRVDDRGVGDIVFEATGSSFSGVGADGVELDEGDAGDVLVNVRDSSFDGNGGYCVIVEANPTLDPNCFDEGELDLDDAFDVDEAGDGSLYATVSSTTVNNNLDEGLDYDEEDAGDIQLTATDVHTANNGDEGIKCSEEGDGNVDVVVRASSAIDNGNDGMEFESEDAGRTDAVVTDTVIQGSSGDGLQVTQEDAVDLGTLKLRDVDNADGLDLENVILI